jgi:tight adherence protein C
MGLAILVSLVLFVALATAIVWFGYVRYARTGQVYGELERQSLVSTLESPPEGHPSTLVRVVQIFGEQVPISPEEAGMTKRLLVAAGYREEAAVTVYAGVRIFFALTVILVAVTFALVGISNPAIKPIPILFGALLGFHLPGMMLERMILSRQARLRMSLPDALDLMVVCVESGLGLDQAINNVARELRLAHRELSEELALVNLEMRAGKRRAEALKNLAARTGEGEIRKLVAIMIQTDRFGTSIADGLRTHSDFMRVRRRQEAEERAGKVGVKLVFPIFFLILPSMLVVAAGPGLLQVFKHLFPMMRQFRQV